ncbi:hypothetical protein [Sorangium sp. So ce341]|uniref:hypothetical protein n=1 Tax=Sorangium sp. So ce341 TaxID=3133302 RepID=UPI003F642895
MVRPTTWVRNVAALFAALSAIAAAPGCSDNDCQDGCEGGFRLTIKTKDNALPAGEYTLDISLDGEEVHCAYSWTGEPKDSGGFSYFDCSWPVELTLYPVIECTEAKAGDPASERCEQVPGQFKQVVHIGRTPARIDVTERRDGVLVGERSFSPRYTTHEDECGSCDGDAQEWTLE